ncbi:MARVEL domain-containing protein 2 [Bombina bombina]|uniref:MARVEL domain-containing protein 2 n=1 Tax=Bombina bombina TaxID=8345 RepID=UPI00235A9BA0|nr:MARVEL domain-containing protein 2 [Bombina bombina]XP_053557425.1 MARVEL domain-containing protein 2 [Bombina bombina]
MSAGGTSSDTRSKGRRTNGLAVHYDEVPLDSSLPQNNLQNLQNSDLALSSDPLPPPPLPLHPPFGPEFYPSDSEEPVTTLELRPVRRFIPSSWKNFFRGKQENQWEEPTSEMNYISKVVECSPPPSPSLAASGPHGKGSAVGSKTASSYQDAYGSDIPLQDPYGSLGRQTHTVKTYSEKVEEYNLRYSYMKSWAGLLRILCIVELLLGAAVFACITAYIHKDNEWYNMFGYTQPYGYTASMQGGYYYNGPKTPFVLVVAGLAWLVTIILLVLGMSMYYRTILLDSNWWPLTEFGLNIALFILYLSAATVYVNDTNRGGLCYYQLFNTPVNAGFCRVEGGQTAAIIFLFVTMIVYLISAIVCLKLWRHEGSRRRREYIENEMRSSSQIPPPKLMRDVALGNDQIHEVAAHRRDIKMVEMQPELLSGYIPAGHIPKPIVMPDYVAKYQSINSDDERDRYKAVFNDQFSEYKELSAEVQAVIKKFSELDTIMSKLPRNPENQQEYERISKVLQEYQKKRNDPSFLEKKERCEYLKNKLSHIKQRIQEYDKVMNWNDGFK